MGIGSFLAGLFLGSSCSSGTVDNHKTTIVHNPIQYPDDWDNYSNDKKLEWLKNRSHWREYYQLKESLCRQIEFKLVEGNDICFKVMDSIVRNKGDKTEAEQLFLDYLNEKYMFSYFNDTTRTKIKMKVDRVNDYILQNYSSISQFYRPAEDYRFEVKLTV